MSLSSLKKFYNLFFVGYNKYDLALYRIIYFCTTTYFFGYNKYFVGMNLLPPELWEPNGIVSLFLQQPIKFDFFILIFNAWYISLFFCIFGFFYKWTGPICFLLGIYIANQGHSYGYQTHTFMPVFLALLPICFSNASDVLSLDSVFFKNKIKDKGCNESDYSWPIRSVQFIFCLVFFSAGFSKLIHGGLQWITSDTLRNYFIRAHLFYFDVNNFASNLRINEWLYQHELLCHIMAAVTVVVELACIAAFFSHRLAKFIIPTIFLFQFGVVFTMYVNFIYYTAIYLSWIKWSKVFRIRDTSGPA